MKLTDKQKEALDKVGKNEEDVIYKYEYGRRRKAVKLRCEYCGKVYKARLRDIYTGGKNVCSNACAAKVGLEAANRANREALDKKVKIAKSNPVKWNNDIAYLVGLITSDGTLDKNRPVIGFANKDMELMRIFKHLTKKFAIYGPNKIRKRTKGGSYWYRYAFTSRRLRYFLEDIGLIPNKSKTIGRLDIPNKYFPDFLRGEIDGDGYFGIGDCLRLSIVSGSEKFINYLIAQIQGLFGVENHNTRDVRGSTELRYYGKYAKKIALEIYNGGPYLSRKKAICDKVL